MTTTTIKTANPYVGPSTFQIGDRDRYFGREREASALLARVVSERLLLFYAQSGAGKSSLINARLIPQLEEQEYFAVLPVGRVGGALPHGVPADTNPFLYNLMASLDLPPDRGRVYEIGGADVVSYDEIMREYARQRGLRRWMIPVSVLTPSLSSLWLGLTTPLYARVGRKLIESLRSSTVVRDGAARADFDIRPAGLQESIRRAIHNENRRFAATRWSDGAVPGCGHTSSPAPGWQAA